MPEVDAIARGSTSRSTILLALAIGTAVGVTTATIAALMVVRAPAMRAVEGAAALQSGAVASEASKLSDSSELGIGAGAEAPSNEAATPPATPADGESSSRGDPVALDQAAAAGAPSSGPTIASKAAPGAASAGKTPPPTPAKRKPGSVEDVPPGF